MDIMELLKTRRTYRRFDQSRPVPDEVIADIIRSEQYASCGNNRQPLRYVVVKTPELVEKVYEQVRWAASLPPEQGTPKEGEHPTLFVVVLEDLKLKNAGTGCDAGLAISNMTLAAWSHGVGSCIMGNIRRSQIVEILGIDPEQADIHSVIAFGYPTHTSRIEEVDKVAPLAYYLDEDRNYVVPRRKTEDVVTIL